MWTLLGHCEGGVHEIYNEIDHIISYAAQSWQQRSGGHGTRDHSVQETKVKVRIGKEKLFAPGPEIHADGRNGTPPSSPCRSSPSPGLGKRAVSTTSDVRSGILGSNVRLGPPGSRSGSRPLRASKEMYQEVLVPDFIIAECPKLLEMYRAGQGHTEIGPLKRDPRIFETVVGLCKLRWLLKLNYALIALAGARCSLHRMLVGTVTDICSAHQYPHSPLEAYELVVATLQTRFQQAWPLLMAYVGSYDCDNSLQGDSKFSPKPFIAPHMSVNGQPMPYEAPYSPTSYLGKDCGTGHPDHPAFLWQVVDDLFIAWIAQQDPIDFPVENVWQELDFYGVPRPAVQTKLEGLAAWQKSKPNSGSVSIHLRPAQRQAHHLAMMLELRDVRAHCAASDDELLEMARDVVAHPRTFNSGTRTRVAMVLQGRDELVGFLDESSSIDMDVEQLTLYLSHSADARDSGRLNPGQLQTLRDSSPPWPFAGREARFKEAAKVWPDPLPRPNYMAEFDLNISKPIAGSSMSQMMSWQSSDRKINTPNTPIWR